MMAYKTGQHTTNASTEKEDQDSIKLISEAASILRKLSKINTCEKNFYHHIGLQGFKRMHRYSAREAWEDAMELDCLLIDHYGMEPEYMEMEYTPPTKRGVMDRLDYYVKELEMVLDKLNEIKTTLVMNNHHFAACFIQCDINSVEKAIKYAYRHLNFAKDVSANMKDMHWYSHELHEEFKDKEEEKHHKTFE